MSQYKLILFDRDGTLTYENKNYHRDLQEVKGYPFVASTLQQLLADGFKLAVVTNQSGIGRGFWEAGEVTELHKRLANEWSVDLTWYVCPHLPDDGCTCRKPNTGMIDDALGDHHASAAETIMIGDSQKDAEAASAAGIEFALVLTGRGRETLASMENRPQFIADISEIGSLLG